VLMSSISRLVAICSYPYCHTKYPHDTCMECTMTPEIADRFASSLPGIRSRASAILCFERDYAACHRQVLAEKLESDGFHVMHL